MNDANVEDIKTLSDAISDDKQRHQLVTVFVDMTGSTEHKEKNPETTWLATYYWFFGTITTSLMDAGGEMVKFTGDGVMVVFPDDKAVDAVNASIKIHETIADAIERNRVEVKCSIGIATGDVVRFATPGKNSSVDYIGTTVDRAARLCSAANPMALFVDSTTIAAANAMRISSQVGSTSPRRVADEYVGSPQSIPLKGFNGAVQYYEILWSRERYGLTSEVVTNNAKPPRIPDSNLYGNLSNVRRPEDRPPSQDTRAGRLSGQVSRWFGENTRGFIKGEKEEDFYTDSRYLASPMSSLTDGAKVFFIPREAPRPGERRTATCVVELNQTLKGSLVQIHPSNAYGFVEVEDEDGTSQDIYVHLDRNSDDLQVRDIIEFRVSENALGPIGVEARIVVD